MTIDLPKVEAIPDCGQDLTSLIKYESTISNLPEEVVNTAVIFNADQA